MGIRGLRKYMCQNVENGYIKIDIKEEIMKFKNENNVESPLIVFNITGLMKILFSDKMDMICGGRHLQYYEKMKTLLDKFKSCNANLVFFAEGYQNNHQNNVKTKNAAYTQTIKLLNMIYSGATINSLTDPNLEYTDNCMPLVKSYESGIYKLLKNYGKIRYILNNLCDLELTKFASVNNALAVVGDNTNYLIYKGKWKYWSSKDINIDAFQTMEFNRVALLKHLRIKPQHLSLFATCAGNNINDCSYVNKLHSRITNIKGNRRMKDLVRYVRQYEYPNNLSSDELKKITIDFYGEYKKEYLHNITLSLDSYNYSKTDKSFNPEDPNVKVWVKYPKIYNIVVGGRIQYHSSSYFDYREKEFLPFPEIILPICQRQIGVLLKHRSDESDLTVTFVLKKSHDKSYEHMEVKPIYPDMGKSNAPHYTVIYENENGQHFYRFQCLLWMITNNLLHNNDIKNITRNYLTDVLTLYYLVKLKQLTIFEADVILLTIDEINQNGIPNDIVYPERLKKRPTLIAFLYTTIYYYIYQCFQIVGLEKHADHLKFDGVYFHNLMETFNYDEEIMKESIGDLQTYRIYAAK